MIVNVTSITVEVIAGPDRSPPVRLEQGRFVVGRHPDATVRIEDPTVARHHLLISFESSAPGVAAGDRVTLSLVVLAGANRTELDGEQITDMVTVPLDERPVRLRLGGSEIEVAWSRARHDGSDNTPVTTIREASEPVKARFAERPFVPREPDRADQVRTPELPTWPAAPPTTALTGAGVALFGALVIARLLGSVLFVAFAGIAALTAVATYLGGWMLARRRRRLVVRQWASDLDRFDVDLTAARSVAAVVARRSDRGVDHAVRASATGVSDGAGRPGLWQVRPEDGRLRVVVGRAESPWAPPPLPEPAKASAGQARFAAELCDRVAAHREVIDVPIVAEVGGGAALAVVGAGRASVVRSLVAQLVWNIGPVDLELAVVTDRPRRWNWVARLPHGGVDGATHTIVDVGDLVNSPQLLSDRLGATTMTTLVVLDADRNGAVETIVRSTAARAAVLVVADEAPGWVDAVVAASITGVATLSSKRRGDFVRCRFVGISPGTAAAIAQNIAPLRDPELATSAIPGECGFGEVHHRRGPLPPLDPFDAASIAQSWRLAGDDPPPIASIGWSVAGVESIDLDRDGPHALIAGTTGAGKSELLRSLVAGLAVRSAPDHLAFLLIDYKGGAAFDVCAELPHAVGVITDLDDALAARALRSLEAEMRRRELLFRAVGATDLANYRSVSHDVAGSEQVARMVIVVDEFASLARELPEFLAALVDIGRRGRSLGIHLVLATQRPGGVVSDDLRANAALRIALRVTTASESIDVVSVPDAARIARSLPGRAIRSVDGGTRLFQTATCTLAPGGVDSELSVVVGAVRQAAAADRRATPSAPWCPPLPSVIGPQELTAMLASEASPDPEVAAPIGVVDDPDRQRQTSLRWSPGDGSLAVIGRVGSGTTTTLVSVTAAALGTLPPDQLHLYVLDGSGDHRLDALAALAHAGGVVRPGETERVRRLVARLARLRSAGSAKVLLVVDGLEAVRATLREADDSQLEREVMDLFTGADNRGIELLVGARGDLGVLRGIFREVWVGAVDDVTIARSAGWCGGDAHGFVPGRFGIVSTQLEAQVARGAPGLAELPAAGVGGGPRPLAELPADVRLGDLPSGGKPGEPLVIGLDAVDIAPTGPVFDPGQHFLVVGRPGSGVSTALATIADAWLRRFPSGRLVWISSPDDVEQVKDLASVCADSTAPHDAVDRPLCLVVVDDADRIDDADGTLGALIDGQFANDRVSVVAGLRADAYRQAYGHWTRRLAAGEHGIALARSEDPPIDVFGVPAPRRALVPARPGLGWMVEAGTARQLQIAVGRDRETGVDAADGNGAISSSGWCSRAVRPHQS